MLSRISSRMGWDSIWRRWACGIRQRVEEPLPVVERHVRVRPLGKDIAGKDRQPRKKGPPLRFAPDTPEVEQRPGGIRESPVASALVRKLQGNGVGQDQVRRIDHAAPRAGCPCRSASPQTRAPRPVGFEIQVQLLRRAVLRLRRRSPCAGPGGGTRRSQAREERGPARSPSASAGR